MNTTKDRLEAAAMSNGWTVTDLDICTRTFKRGRDYIDVTFDVSGRIIRASHAKGRLAASEVSQLINHAARVGFTPLCTCPGRNGYSPTCGLHRKP